MGERGISLSELLARLEREPERRVVVPNNRAAAAVRSAFDRRQQAAGRPTWAAANVLSWSQWLSSMWTSVLLNGLDDRLLLNQAQEHLLWREIVAADTSTSSLTPVDALADLAASAWKLAAEYRASGKVATTAGTQDERVFADWADEFARKCGRDRLLAAAELEAALERHILKGWSPASDILLCAMTQPTPTQRSLLAALEESGGKLERLSLVYGSPARTPAAALLLDERAELRFAVRWLRQFIPSNPHSRAALLVPELTKERAELEPLLREILAPELEDLGADLSAAPWEISVTSPLSHIALVRALVDAMRWIEGPLTLDRISGVILSPYFANSSSAAARARFDAGVLQRQLLLRPELELRTVLQLTRRENAFPELAVWLGSLYELGMELAAAPPRRSYADWTEWFRLLARSTGWPGDRTLTPVEQAATQAFDAVLDLLATLDFSDKRITFSEALDALRRQLALSPCPVASAGAALQVMTPSEAVGQVFDAVVFVRATDANLPPKLRTNPLLSWGLQKNFAMPGTDAELDRVASVENLERLLACAGTVLFTSAAMADSGALRASAFVRSLDQPAAIVVDEAASPAVALEVVPDTAPLPPLPNLEIGGGSRLLKLQAACGFLAFAELRLGGREPESHDAGFDAIESGNVLHRALEAFWKHTRTQQRLREMSDAERTAQLEKAIDAAISHKLNIASPWDRAYIDVQKQRMLTVLRRWMDFELERGPFAVLDSERKETIAVGPLHLQVRMDRIDVVSDGRGGTGVVFVDYKTGAAAKLKSWEGSRPDEPQLPLYALAGDAAELQGLAFAKVRAGSGMEWTGLAAGEEVLPKKGSRVVDLEQYAAEWRVVLDQLAEDFASGATHVKPKSYAVNCKRCAQRLLCRLNVNELMEQTADEDEAEADLE